MKRQVLSHAQRSQLSDLTPRVKLSLAQLTAKERKKDIDFKEIIQPGDWGANLDGQRVYGHISALSDQFITTNYDQWLDTVRPRLDIQATTGETAATTPLPARTVLHQPEKITPDAFAQRNVVVHLHGSVLEPDKLVLSTGDYLLRYVSDRHREGGEGENPILTFLEHVFRTKTCLFLGYGLEELEILEYIILKGQAAKGTKEARHYALQGFFSFETELSNAMQSYFLNECGVQLIPFLKDENDWHQLIHVLDNFATLLPTNSAATIQEFLEMKALMP